MAVKLDASKANVNTSFDLEIRFDGEYAQYDRQIVAKVKHLTAKTQEKCFTVDADGNRTISAVAIFKNHCTEIHGLVHEVDGVDVEYTPDEICNLSKVSVRLDGKPAGGIIDLIIAQVTTAILKNHSLNKDEQKN